MQTHNLYIYTNISLWKRRQFFIFCSPK